MTRWTTTHASSATEIPHDLSAERLHAAATALRNFASADLDTLPDDVSPRERVGLAKAADLAVEAVEGFSRG